MDKGSGAEAVALLSGWICYFLSVLRRAGGRLSDIDWIGRGKAVLETLFERALEPGLVRVLAIGLGLCVGLLLGGVFRICHALLQAASARRLRVNNAPGVACVPGWGRGTRPSGGFPYS